MTASSCDDVSFLECETHCSLCYNETECYECTQGYYLTLDGRCDSKSYFEIVI